MSNIHDNFKKLVNVKIELDGVEYPNDYADQLDIDKTNLDEEFLEHSTRYAYYATMAGLAEDRHQRAKEELDKLKADLDHEIRAKKDAIIAQNPKFKLTEAMITNEIVSDARYQKKLSATQTARHLATVLKNAPMAFAHRRDMLIELGKTAISGMTDPRVQQGRQQQVRQMFAAKTAQRVAPVEALPVPEPDDLEATSFPVEGEEVDFTPSVTEAPTTTNGRRRTPKTA